MKKRPKLQVGGAITGAIMLLVLVLGPEGRKAAAWKIKVLTRSRFYYPTSKSFLGVHGEPFPALEERLSGQIYPKDNDIFIHLGDIPNDVSRVVPYQYLSSVIRMHPEKPSFKMTWNTRVVQYANDFTLTYNRGRGEVTLTQFERGSQGSLHTKLLGKYLTDRDIHEAGLDAAKNWTDVEDWAAKHWDH